MKLNLEREFEIAKTLTIAKSFKLNLVQRTDISNPTFDVFDEYIAGVPLHSATICFDGSKWRCVGHVFDEDSKYSVCAIFAITKSPYEWEDAVYLV